MPGVSIGTLCRHGQYCILTALACCVLLDIDQHVHQRNCCRYAWAFLITQRELVRSALGGMGLSFAMAFLVLNVSTGNLHMAFLSTFTVAGIVATSLGLGVVGVMKWPLGISESISVVILIGFSMDYVLHLAGVLPLRFHPSPPVCNPATCFMCPWTVCPASCAHSSPQFHLNLWGL